MKKITLLLTSLLLLVSIFISSDYPLRGLAAATTSKSYDSTSFLSSDIASSPVASFYYENEPSRDNQEAYNLNQALTGFEGKVYSHLIDDTIINTSTRDILPEVISQLELLGQKPIYEVNGAQDLTFLPIDESDYLYIALYYNNANPIMYFDKSSSDEISFYIRPFFLLEDEIIAFKNLIKKYDIVGSLPILTIEGETIINLSLSSDHDFTIETAQGVSLTLEHRSYRAGTGGRTGYNRYLRVTMPKRDSFLDIKFLSLSLVLESASIADTNPSAQFSFTFHSSMMDRVYFYLFNIKSLSIANLKLVIDDSSYAPFLVESTSYSNVKASLINIKLHYKSSLRFNTKPDEAISSAIKSTQIAANGREVTFYSVAQTPKTFTCKMVSNNENSWSFEALEGLDKMASGEFTIQSISFHPIIDGVVREDLTYTQDYNSTNIYKYSYDAQRSARIYYYYWQGYYRTFSKNDPNGLLNPAGLSGMAAGAISGILNILYSYQTFGFSFYFDDNRQEAIPNVQRIRLKWQCGYEEPNAEKDSGGFYPDTKDEKKKINIAEKEVGANESNLQKGNYALDKDGMFISYKDNCDAHFSKNGQYDYVVAKQHKKGDINTYITTMAPLEISYETFSGEVVRMIGNSQGLHIFTDEYGNDFIVNSEGVAPTNEDNLSYGIYEAEDGTKYPGVDKNNDGVITADEVINSDTGEGENLANPHDANLLSAIVDFFDKIGKAAGNPWFLILIIIIVALVALIILKPSSLINLVNSIKLNKALSKKQTKKNKSKKRGKKT